MRLQQWLATTVVVACTLLVGDRIAMAQRPVAVSYGNPPAGDPASYPEMLSENVVPHYSTVLSHTPGYADVPPGMLPYPQISPFENRYSEHSNEGGLWFEDSSSRPRQFYGGVSAILFRLRKPEEALFGNKAFRSRTVGVGEPIRLGVAQSTFHVFDKNFKTAGVRIHWGFLDADDTGLEITTWWAKDFTDQFKIGQEIDPGDPATALSKPGVVPVGNGGAGDVLTFDRLFQLRYETKILNLQADRLFHPWWKNGAIKIRPLAGIRYMFLRESLRFKGIDGGPPFFVSFMDTKSRSHLVGPEFGLQGEIGGDSFKLIFASRFILFANIERQQLTGDNFGTAAQVNLGGINSFTQTISTSHISPAFEQTVHVEAKLLQFVPFVNRLALFRDASFRVGFTFFNVAEVARPGNSVKFRGLPQKPELVSDRSKFSFTSWDLGVVFKY